MVARPINFKSCAAAVLLAFLSACGPSVPAPDAATPAAPRRTEAPVAQPAEAAPAEVVETSQVRIRVAILLPLTGGEAETGHALLNAATMALFDAYDPRLELLPFDTQADPDVAAEMAQRALDEGVAIVLGPLLADNVTAAGRVLDGSDIPLVGFSNDSRVAGPGRYVMGFLPETEVQRVIDYAIDTGMARFAALLPEGRYGARVRLSFGEAVASGGGQVTAMESYPPDAEAVFEPVKRLAGYDERRRALQSEIRFLRSLRDDATDEIADQLEKAETLDPVPFQAVLVPEGGSLLRTVAPLLPYYEVDPANVKLMGTGLWNDPSLFNEPPLQGAWFAAPAPEGPTAFRTRYEQTYGATPPRIATLAYDAVALVAALARDWKGEEGTSPFSADRLTDPRGFNGTDGLFRFLDNGANERALAVLEVHRSGLKVLAPAPSAFPAFGYLFRQLASQEEN